MGKRAATGGAARTIARGRFSGGTAKGPTATGAGGAKAKQQTQKAKAPAATSASSRGRSEVAATVPPGRRVRSKSTPHGNKDIEVKKPKKAAKDKEKLPPSDDEEDDEVFDAAREGEHSEEEEEEEEEAAQEGEEEEEEECPDEEDSDANSEAGPQKAVTWSQRTDSCLRCFICSLSFPQLDWPTFCEEVGKGASGKKSKVKKALESMGDMPDIKELAPFKREDVTQDSLVGYTVKSKYLAYTPADFLKEFGVEYLRLNTEKGKIKIKLVELKNEMGQQEEMILLKSGAREVELFSSGFLNLRESIMARHIRRGQGADTLSWAAKKGEEEGDRKFAAQSQSIPTLGQLQDRVAAYQESLRQAEEQAEKSADSNDEDDDDEEDGDAGGLQLPRQATVGKKKDKKKEATKKRASSGGAGRSKPPAEKRRKLPGIMNAAARGELSVQMGAPLAPEAVAGIGFSAPGSGASQAGGARSAVMDLTSEARGPAPSVNTVKTGAGGRAKVDCYFDFHAIVSGQKTLTVMTGAKRHLATLTDSKLKNKLSKEIDCATLCFKLIPPARAGLTLVKMQEILRDIRALCKFDMPLSVHLSLCAKYVTNLLKQEQWAEVSASLRVWTLDGEPAFSEEQPRFSALIAKHASDEQAVASIYYDLLDAFFSGGTCDLFAEPIERGTLGHPFCLADSILSAYAKAEEQDDLVLGLSDTACSTMDKILTACRAIAAVSSATPGIHGCSYKDARLVFDHDYTGEPDEGDIKADEFEHLRTAALKSPVWKSRIGSFWTLGLEDGRLKGPYAECLAMVSKKDMTLEEARSAMASTTSWAKVLRSGACDAIYEKLTEWVLRMWDVTNAKPSSTTYDATELCSTIRAVVLQVDPRRNDKRFLQLFDQVSSFVAHAEAATSIAALTALANSPDKAMLKDGVDDIKQTIAKCVGMDLAPEVGEQLIIWRGAVHGAFVDAVRQATLIPPSWEQYLENIRGVSKTIQSFPYVASHSADDTTKTLLDMGTSCVMLSANLSQTEVPGAAEEEIEEAMLKLLRSRSVVAKAVVGVNVAESQWHIKNLQEHAKGVLAKADALVTDKVQGLRKALGTEIAKALARLKKVSGGGSDGESWKQKVDKAATIQDIGQKPLEMLRGTYVEAIKKRSTGLLEAPSKDTLQAYVTFPTPGTFKIAKGAR